MQQIANNLWQLYGFPANGFNIYLAGDVLVDAGTRWARSRIGRQLQGRKLSLMALTHVHPDHQGSASWVCDRFRVPLACHEADVPFMEGRLEWHYRNLSPELADQAFAELGGRA